MPSTPPLRPALPPRGLLAAAVIPLALVANPAHAEGQGWYTQLSVSYERLDSADARLRGGTSAPGSNCLLGNLLGVGTLLDTIGLTDDTGCLLTLIGPGVPGLTGPSALTKVRYDKGFGAMGAIGYRLGSGLRPELAFHFARNDWDRITLVGENLTAASENRFDADGLFANLWWDFLSSPRVRPYVGGGIGYQSLKLSGDLSDRAAGAAAFQLGAGVALALKTVAARIGAWSVARRRRPAEAVRSSSPARGRGRF